MRGVVVTRNRITVLLATTALAAALAWWWWRPEPQLRRSWRDLLSAVDARNTTRLGRLIASDYTDRWGNTRPIVLEDAAGAFFRVENLKLHAEQVGYEIQQDHATITAILRVDVTGDFRADEFRVEVNRLFSPFTFEWRHESGYPGSWTLLRLDQPELNLGHLKNRW